MDNIQEIWKDVPGYEGFYQVSNGGLVASVRFNKFKILKTRGMGGAIGQRYLACIFCINYDRVTMYVHRAVALAFVPNPNEYPIINHLDGDRQNNIPSNLEWSTQSQNIQHAIKRIGKWQFKNLGLKYVSEKYLS